MDHSADHLRREARESQREHVAAMASMREVVARLFGAPTRRAATARRTGATATAQSAKAALVTNGLNRRRFLHIGGLSIATAAVFAACGSDDDTSNTAEGAVDDATDQNGGGPGAAGDITILRTASSIELLAVDVYRRAIESGVLGSGDLKTTAELFRTQHDEHAQLFLGATRELGGEPFAEPNPVLMQQLQPRLAALTDQNAALRLALDLENAAAATYYASVGELEDEALDRAVMSVGGIEARHAAVLAGVLGEPPVPRSFRTADGAVAPGTGL